MQRKKQIAVGYALCSTRIERVEVDNSALAKWVTQLDAALGTERENRRAVERKLEVAEQEQDRVVIVQQNDERLCVSSEPEARTEAAHGAAATTGTSYRTRAER